MVDPMTTSSRPAEQPLLTVGQVARQLGVSVRTLHFYDEVGLAEPSARSHSGYRLYTTADLARLDQVVRYRRLEIPVELVADLLAGSAADRARLLGEHRRAVAARLSELERLVVAIDQIMTDDGEGMMSRDTTLREVFGDSWQQEWQDEAAQRWGQTDAYRESARRASRYTKADWITIKAQGEEVQQALIAAFDAGHPAGSVQAMDAAEGHRRHIDTWFYPVSADMHRGLAAMYLADDRFRATYDDARPGLAHYVHDAIHANAVRLEA